MHPNVYSSAINNSHSMERAHVHRWMNDKGAVYIYIYTHTHTMEYYSAIKKNEILPFVTTWMELKGILNKIN